jgi:PD-(D/E)XK nuclease superfamily
MLEFAADNAVLVEIKIAPQYDKRDEAQLLNVLKATGLTVGILLNSADTKWNTNGSSSESVFHLCPSVAGTIIEFG